MTEEKEDNGKQLSNLNFQDGINLGYHMISDIIKSHDDKARNISGMLMDHITEAFNKISDKYEIDRINQMYKHFNIELD